MMRKIQKKRKSSTEKDAASDNTSTEEDGKVDLDDPDQADSDVREEEGEFDVWRHFARLDGAFAQCGHCEKKVDCGTSLVFLRGHLKRRHPTVYNKKTGTSSKTVKGATDEDKNMNSDSPLEKDNAEDDSFLNRKCRAGVWQFFVRLNKTSAQCKTCKRDLNYSASISNLKRHLKLKHPSEYTQLTQAKVSFSWQKKEKERSPRERKRKRAGKLTAVDVNDCIDENEALDSGSEYQPETDDSDHLELDVKDAKKPPKRRKSDAWVWSSFEKIDQETARCTLCEKSVDYRNSVSNLRKHLDRQHSEETGGASVSFRDCADEDASDPLLEKEDSDSLQTALDETCSRLLRRRKSDLWNHFSTLSKEIAQCKHCLKNLNYRSSATNLKRHLRVMHPRAHTQLGKAKNAGKETGSSFRKEPSSSKTSKKNSTATQKNNRNEKSPAKRKSAVHKYNSKDNGESSSDDNEMPSAIHDASGDDSADESEQRPVRSSDDAFSKIANSPHKGVKSKPAKKERTKQATSVPYTPRPKIVHAKRKRSRLWDFFTVLDDVYAECNTCKHRLVHKSGLSNLAKHYSMKHANPAPAPATTTEQQQNAVSGATTGTQAGMSEIEMAVNSLNNGDGQPPPDGQAIDTSGASQPKKRGRRKTTGENHWRCAIWRLFSKLDETFSQCKSCHKRISHRSTNANLLKHTRIKHPHIYYKFEERLKDFSHNVNILVDHFFPESLITASASGNSATEAAPSHEAGDQMPQQEYHMTENQPPQMYDGYSFPVIFVQEEEAVHTSSGPIATTTVITSAPPNPIQVPPTNLPGPSPYGMGGHTITPSVGSHPPLVSATNLSSTHMPNHVQDPSPLNMVGNGPSNQQPINNHQPSYVSEGVGVVSHVGGVSGHIVGGSNNVGAAVGSHGGTYPFSGNYQQVLTASFSGGVAQSSDRLIGMVEESNQLLRGMQTAIERQSDVLIRLAESIATGMRTS